MVKWREEISGMRSLGKFFITTQSYDDFLASIDGLIWYIVTVVKKYPDCDVVTWYLTSNSLEQLFAWLRTGIHAGRKTNLDASIIFQGCGKRNLPLCLDGDGLHLLEHSVAHTRGKQLFSVIQDALIFKGEDTCLEELKEAMKKGMELGETKFEENTDSFSKGTGTVFSDDEADSAEDESEEEPYSDNEEDTSVDTIDIIGGDDDTGLMEFSGKRMYHF